METKLKVLKAKKNISMGELSKKINISSVTLYKLANGKLTKPKYESFKKVSDYFNIKVVDLL